MGKGEGECRSMTLGDKEYISANSNIISTKCEGNYIRALGKFK